MKLKDYAKEIDRLAELYPDAEVVYAIDDEGNEFHPVIYSPDAGWFGSRLQFETRNLDINEKEINAVCVN